MKNLMIDIETLGNKPNSAILQIAAVSFDPTSGEMGNEFSVNISPKSCEKLGMKIQASTVEWWMQQSDEARDEVFYAKCKEALK